MIPEINQSVLHKRVANLFKEQQSPLFKMTRGFERQSKLILLWLRQALERHLQEMSFNSMATILVGIASAIVNIERRRGPRGI